MRLSGFSFEPYRLPLIDPWISAQGTFVVREGWLIRLTTEDGRIGYGDCAPLPQAGSESVACAQSRLMACAESLPGTLLEDLPAKLEGLTVAAPSVRNGLETALLDLFSQQAGRPLAQWLNPCASSTVKVNAMIGGLDRQAPSRAMAAIHAGFAVLKLKVGLASVRDELAMLRAVSDMLPPGTALRLDANCAWNEAQAAEFLCALDGVPVESVEDPQCYPDVEALSRLQASVVFPIAADESLLKLGAGALLGTRAVRRLVLKPMLLGGLRPALAIATQARDAGLECVVTSTVDSAVGVRAAMHLAAAVDNGLAHGLATSAWLARDVGLAPQPVGGVLTVGKEAGLGFAAFD